LCLREGHFVNREMNRTEYTNLEAKVAIITGGGSGIGRGIAQALARQGTRCVVCGRRKHKLDETVQLIADTGGEALAVQADVSSEKDVDRLVKATLQVYGRIDILINNAAIFEGAELHALETDVWERTMAINLRGPFLTTRAVLPTLRAQHSGHIINISSESGLEYYDGDSAYGTSKHALIALGEYTQRENQEFNIRVNTICPGMVVSEMSENEPGLDLSKCLYPEDIADLVVWLLTRRQNIKIGTPILIQTMLNPWQ
jgi:3-oxoacyl-[acyl-carrier protein] reductase